MDLVFSGDLVLDEPEPDHWLSGIAPALNSASLAIGHLEVPHTRRGHELAGDVPAPGADPAHVSALKRAGFAAVTLAGNHIADCGAEGIADTVAELDRLGIAHCGAGADLEGARKPAWLTAGGTRVALLSYNCVGPEAAWAAPHRAGCAYVRIETADGGPITPAAALSRPDPASLAAMVRDIQAVRSRADCVIVALHKGIVHTPARLAPYERPLAHAAVDAGADVVIGHHAHILRGIEVRRGRPIFHGLGNGCVVTRALSPTQSHGARAAWAIERRRRFGFEPDPAYELAPFHPEAVNGMLAWVRREPADGRLEFGILPVRVEPPGRPVIAPEQAAQAIVRYVQKITLDAGLPRLTLCTRARPGLFPASAWVLADVESPA
ncbi:MAG TPA: CapA family protein [Steroidobacteraceae bacterium]|nr:CapA family protein [Steroidobacteraceae bacterium]